MRREAEAQDWGFRAPSFHSTSRNRTLPISPDRTYRVIISSNLFSILPMEEQWRTRGLRYVGTQNFVKCIYQSLHLMGLRHWYGYGCWESKLYLGAFSAGLLTTSMLLWPSPAHSWPGFSFPFFFLHLPTPVAVPVRRVPRAQTALCPPTSFPTGNLYCMPLR